MHVALVIAAGLVSLGIFVLFGWLWGTSAGAMAWAAKAFVPVWLLMALANLWVGVYRAGYALRDEALILVPTFALPAAAAGLVAWYLARG